MIDAQTAVTGILGWPVSHSLSPAMHNAAFEALALNWIYVAFPVHPDRVAAAVEGLAATGCRGANVTVPHKAAVLASVSGRSAAVEAIGAANTLVPDGDGGFWADNTDAEGFLRAFDEATGVDVSGQAVLVIGAGGAARAVVWALGERGANVTLSNRTDARAAELSNRTVPFTPDALRAAAGRALVVVNTTSLGMGRTEVPVELPEVGPGQVAYDLVYRPGGVTPWTAACHARGAIVVDGAAMLLHQGAAAFSQWTGVEPPISAMRAALGLPAP